MASVQLETNTEQLLKAAGQLPTDELEQFVTKLLALKAGRIAPGLNEQESVLLAQVNANFPNQSRYMELIAKRKGENLNDSEYRELLDLTDQAESIQVDRLDALSRLAILRQVSLSELIEQLQLKPMDV